MTLASIYMTVCFPGLKQWLGLAISISPFPPISEVVWYGNGVSANSAISWREQVNFQWEYDEVRFVLDQHAELDVYSASSLKQQSAGRYVAPLGHIILIPSQSIFALSP
jgi:hypothetical protein